MKQFFKNWSLPITIITGILGYFLVHSLPLTPATKLSMNNALDVIQPLLIFSMLYISFCKIDFKQLRFAPWHAYLLLIQASVFVLLALVLHFWTHPGSYLILESMLVCFICPTATASVVIAEKLGGKPASLIMYTILVNLMVAIIVPVCLPLFIEKQGISFVSTFSTIIMRVFPLLSIPMLLAYLTRHFFPKTLNKVTRIKDLAFYLWMVALACATALATRAFMHTKISSSTVIGMLLITLFSCLSQFYMGRKIGKRFDDAISAGQAMGQKNTIFLIWLAYTFMDPVCAVAGGFYSIWHNTVNSWQLYKNAQKQPLS